MVPWDQILNFLALRPNAGPTQTHVGYRCIPYDFPVHVDHVFFEDKFFGFQSFLHRCGIHEFRFELCINCIGNALNLMSICNFHVFSQKKHPSEENYKCASKDAKDDTVMQAEMFCKNVSEQMSTLNVDTA